MKLGSDSKAHSAKRTKLIPHSSRYNSFVPRKTKQAGSRSTRLGPWGWVHCLLVLRSREMGQTWLAHTASLPRAICCSCCFQLTSFPGVGRAHNMWWGGKAQDVPKDDKCRCQYLDCISFIKMKTPHSMTRLT